MAIIPLPPWDLIGAGHHPRQRGRVHRRTGGDVDRSVDFSHSGSGPDPRSELFGDDGVDRAEVVVAWRLQVRRILVCIQELREEKFV